MNIEELRSKPNWHRLSDRERRILEMRYHEEHRASLDEIGRRLEIKREMVRQIERRALDKLAYTG